MALVKVRSKFQVTFPKVAREAARLAVGDPVEAGFRGGVIVLVPKVISDRDPGIERSRAASEADYRAGWLLGPFRSVAELGREVQVGSKSMRPSLPAPSPGVIEVPR